MLPVAAHIDGGDTEFSLFLTCMILLWIVELVSVVLLPFQVVRVSCSNTSSGFVFIVPHRLCSQSTLLPCICVCSCIYCMGIQSAQVMSTISKNISNPMDSSILIGRDESQTWILSIHFTVTDLNPIPANSNLNLNMTITNFVTKPTHLKGLYHRLHIKMKVARCDVTHWFPLELIWSPSFPLWSHDLWNKECGGVSFPALETHPATWDWSEC